MARPDRVVVKAGEASLALRFDACRVNLAGEFAGNVEVDVACEPGAHDALLAGLRIGLPGQPPSDPALASGDPPGGAGGVTLVFWCESLRRALEPPAEVALLWDDTPVARIEPTLADAVPLEQAVRFTQPSEIADRPPPLASSGHVLLAANRERWWYALAAALVLCGGLASIAVGAIAPGNASGWALVAALMAAGGAVAGLLARVPYRQVWLDRDRARVLVVAGRSGDPAAKLAGASGRGLAEFDHVRIHSRWQIASEVDQRDQEIWFVSLEGPIRFASRGGSVHLHPEALLLGEHGSRATARRLAAEAGFHTGLPILETGHDRTA